MSIKAEEIRNLISKKYPKAHIEIIDLAGDENHYKVIITSAHFKGLNRVEQHKSIYDTLGSRVGNELHALSLQTQIPSE